MTKDELLALAERVEALTGLDREVDEAIVRALYPEAIVEIYCVGDEEPLVFHAEPLVQNKRVLPAYTASLDAAMTLAGNKFGSLIAGLWPDGSAGYVSRVGGKDAESNTAPCAVVAAALRARAEMLP
jgi:hypothetical protein